MVALMTARQTQALTTQHQMLAWRMACQTQVLTMQRQMLAWMVACQMQARRPACQMQARTTRPHAATGCQRRGPARQSYRMRLLQMRPAWHSACLLRWTQRWQRCLVLPQAPSLQQHWARRTAVQQHWHQRVMRRCCWRRPPVRLRPAPPLARACSPLLPAAAAGCRPWPPPAACCLAALGAGRCLPAWRRAARRRQQQRARAAVRQPLLPLPTLLAGLAAGWTWVWWQLACPLLLLPPLQLPL